MGMIVWFYIFTIVSNVVCACNTGIPRTNSVGRVFDAGSDVVDNLPNSEEAIRRGEYAVIRSLIRVLEVYITSSCFS